MSVNKCFSMSSVCVIIVVLLVTPPVFSYAATGPVPVSEGPTVRKDERWPLVSSEFGEVSGVKISDGRNHGWYYLHFITMNPRSLFLPVYLHSEMILYVNSGSGILSWMSDGHEKLQQMLVKEGDIFRLTPQTVFYMQNYLQNNIQNKKQDQSQAYQPPQKLQIYAIFPESEVQLLNDQLGEAYTGVHELLQSFDDRVLRSTLGVPEEVIEELRGAEKQPLIVEGQPEANTSTWDIGSWSMRALLRTHKSGIFNLENKMKAYNIFSQNHDVETCYGTSTLVTGKEVSVFKRTNFGVFMLNLTKGSMMGPHLNPSSDEVAIVLNGQGVIEVGCPGLASEMGCKSEKLSVGEGDVFVVPRHHPMAQMSFNNGSLVLMGFMLKQKEESPQYLAGKFSILQNLDRKVLEKSFNVRNTTIDWILSNPNEDIIYECISCAEESIQGGGGGTGMKEEGSGGGWQEGKGEGEGGQQEEESGGGRHEGKGGSSGGGGGWQEEERGGEGGRGGWQEQGGSGGWQEQGRGGGGWEEQGGGEGGWKSA